MPLIVSIETLFIIHSDDTIKTFYDGDLQTKHVFYEDNGVNKFCSFFSEFYEEKSEKIKLPNCIRFKQTQTLYCHGELQNFKNYTKYENLKKYYF
jgi:hypothetical protein